MSAIAFIYLCADCDCKFRAPGISEMSYGEFVLRGEHSDEAALLDANRDEVFDEVSGIVKANQHIRAIKNVDLLCAFRFVFGLACDRPPSGDLLRFDLRPKCRSCGSRKMASWQDAYPPEIWPLRRVKHEEWQALSKRQRGAIIDKGIREYLKI